MCGIFAWAGKSVKQFNKAKFDIQGLYNNSRGGDSCGVTSDGEIYYGINASKNYNEFLVNNNYEIPQQYPIVIGHTRKSSSGAITSDNAHPFGFGTNNEGFEFVGVHNGTLHNQSELARSYGVEALVYKPNAHGTEVFDRSKNDSEILLECIYSSKNFKVLSEYNGGAALLFTNTLEPNVLYAYKGASKMEKHGVATMFEERPLYCYVENRSSIYLSSLEESLVAIGGDPLQNIFDLDCNIVYKITNGNFLGAEKILLSRHEAFQRPSYNYGRAAAKPAKEYNYKDYKAPAKATAVTTDTKVKLENIHLEKIEKFYKSNIYMQRLRYWRNGHLISGIYTWVKGYGFKFLTYNVEDIIKSTEPLIGKPFNLKLGEFIKDENIDDSNPDIIYPFNNSNGAKPAILFFEDGVMLKTELDYIAMRIGTKVTYSAYDLSRMSKHPVIKLGAGNVSEQYQNILLDGEKFDGIISPLGSNKVYTISGGNLNKVRIVDEDLIQKPFEFTSTKSKKIDIPVNISTQIPLLIPEVITDPKVIDLNSMADKIDDEFTMEQYQQFIKKNEIEESCECNLTNFSLAKDTIDKTLMPIYIKVQEANNELVKHKEVQFIKDVIETNEDFLISLDEIITNIYK